MSTSQWSAINSLTTKASYLPNSETAILNADSGGGFAEYLDISSDGNYVIINCTSENAAYIFVRSGNSWSKQAKLNAYGYCRNVSIDATGTRVTVGTDTSSGQVQVYSRSGATWVFEASLNSNYGSIDYASSISGDGATIIIGCCDWNSYYGLCVIYTRSGTNWTYRTNITAADASSNLSFGTSVDINYNGTYVVIGTQRTSTGPNCFYVFTGAGTSWTQQAKLITPDTGNVNGDYFGYRVSITDNGDRIITGAMLGGTNGAGKAYIFVRTGSSWSQEAILQAPGPTNLAFFGCSVCISKDGTKVIVGESNGDPPGITDTGRAHLFSRSGSTWSLGATLYASDRSSSSDNFGTSVTMSGDSARVIVGDSAKNSNFGRAYAFS